jgi:phage major head subunit gpT-like protein
MSTTGQYGFLDNKNLIGIWDEMYEPALNGVWATKIGTKAPSTMETESYGWLGAAPGLEQLNSEDATEEQFGKYSYFLRNIEFAKTIKIAEKDMRRDKIGQIQMRIGEMSEKAAEHWNTLAASAILANGNGYDQVAFYSALHAESGTNQSNDLTSAAIPALDIVTPTAPTPLEAASALNAVIGQFYLLNDDKGDPINGQAKDFTVLTGTTNIWSPMNAACNLMTFAQGVQNPIVGLQANNGIKINTLLIPRLAALTTQFLVFRNDSRVKALILQDEVDVTPAVSDRSNDEYIKFRRFLFGIYASRNVGYARWQSTMRGTFS